MVGMGAVVVKDVPAGMVVMGNPPIWVAAFGPKALRQAGRLGLPYLASPMETITRLEENYALHREAYPDEGPPSDFAVPIMRTLFVTRERGLADQARQSLQRQAASLARSGAVLPRPASSVAEWAMIGEPRAVSDAVAEYRERLGMTHLIVRPGIPGIPPPEVRKSLELIAELTA